MLTVLYFFSKKPNVSFSVQQFNCSNNHNKYLALAAVVASVAAVVVELEEKRLGSN
jgi:hypothetical protein